MIDLPLLLATISSITMYGCICSYFGAYNIHIPPGIGRAELGCWVGRPQVEV
jgi:hypothetical protein